MGLMDLILKRRSVRKYAGGHVDENKVERILAAGLLAPTSRNLKPWEFHLVKDKRLLFQMATAKEKGGYLLKDCDCAVVVAADSDTWAEDCAVAMAFMMLAAEEEDVGCCWVQFHLREDSEETIKRMLGLGKKMHLCGALALGEKGEKKNPHALSDADFSKVFIH